LIQEVEVDADTLQRAVKTSREIVASVRPDQMDDLTPCKSWKVRDLLNHMIDAPTFAATVMETGDWTNDSGESFDHASGDYLADYDAATAHAIAAFRADGALSRMVKLPFGELPGAAFASIATGDAFVHGWDLAKATGRPTDFDPELAGEILVAVRPMLPDQMRGSDGLAPFGPEIKVSAEASPGDKLAAFLGRQP
jgi:uncharacterized protein (TIGR03086 family)